MDSLIPMPSVHGDKVMGENASFLRAVFQCYEYIIIVLQSRQCFLCFGVVQEEAIMVAFYEDDLPVQALNESMSVIVSGFPDYVTENIDKIVFVHLGVPSSNKLCIHFVYRTERPVIEGNHILVTECRSPVKNILPMSLSPVLCIMKQTIKCLEFLQKTSFAPILLQSYHHPT